MKSVWYLFVDEDDDPPFECYTRVCPINRDNANLFFMINILSTILQSITHHVRRISNWFVNICLIIINIKRLNRCHRTIEKGTDNREIERMRGPTLLNDCIKFKTLIPIRGRESLDNNNNNIVRKNTKRLRSDQVLFISF